MTVIRPQSRHLFSSRWFPLCSGVMGASTILLLTAAAEDVTTACRLEPLDGAVAVSARDGRSIVLADGREVRLTGLEAPRADTPDAAAAQRRLNTMIAGRDVTLMTARPSADRYGRVMVYAFLPGETLSLQERMLEEGLGRMARHAGGPACAAPLLRQEQAARAARRGLWADGANGPLDAGDTAALAAARGRFAVVEGTVVSVRESRGVVYLNFGRSYTRAVAVTILKRNEAMFTAAGLAPKSLEGRRIRVRGVVEQRRGPVIEATEAEQIERIAASTN